ncbi:DUF4190 domain-containing protein [Amnibacterium sp. CER49]|uniref:DUF4190 domain-containing protein n=1 Tax=Amnibacterium sp. CER49 TaxID=3039161 RepID=UPI00244B7607|nr:DUF4190 domain-containing protein [Amnibacterium sp. CER49]MDH2442393.1 DUF4190 domain-containing protein [Amnibacterium sp. CER49]
MLGVDPRTSHHPMHLEHLMANSPAYDQPSTAPASSTRFNVMAILAIIFTFVFSPAGIVLGIISLSQIRRTGERGHGLAMTALILSVIFLLLSIVIDVAVLPHMLSTASTVK